jgi:hypothetical protein
LASTSEALRARICDCPSDTPSPSPIHVARASTFRAIHA